MGRISNDFDNLEEATTANATVVRFQSHTFSFNETCVSGSSQRLTITPSVCELQKQELLVDVTLMVSVSPEDCVAAVSQLPAEEIYWADSKTFGKTE